MSEPLNPVTLENQILSLTAHCHRGVDVFKDRLQAFLDAETEYEHVKAQAFLDHDGPQTEKRHAAILASRDQRKVMNSAKVEFEYTKHKLEALTGELMAMQNLNKGVRAMYGAEKGFGG